jgi:UDP-N-acetyl-D-mannosaminouronate:lipid I N-acetyl-D-mannosaminouronosyltransferase
MKQKGYKNASKIAGCELWLKIIARYENEKTFYLVGAKPEVIAATEKKLREEFPNIRIVGCRDGYIRSEQDKMLLIDDISLKRPDVVFVAMGSPKQELLMEEMQRRHPNAIYQGLGGSFDVYTGNVERAPKWWVDHNMEFAYRLIKQPKRITRNFHFIKYAYWLVTKKL